MADNFLACDRDQAFLLPADLRDWLPADHLAWFILDVVDQLDLHPFLKAYRADGHGRAAFSLGCCWACCCMAYCTGIRSSRIPDGTLAEVAIHGLPALHGPRPEPVLLGPRRSGR